MKHLILKSVVSIMGLFTTTTLFCQSYEANNKKTSPHLYIYPELFMPAISTTVRVDGNITDIGIGTAISLEKDLSFSSSPNLFRIQAIAGEGSQFAFSYMMVNRKETANISRDIAFDDTVYHAGVTTHAYFNSQVFAGTWRFAIINNSIWTAGLSFGLRWLQIETGINVESDGYQYARDQKVGVPAPLAGLHGSVYITSHVLARTSLEYFHINLSGYEATARDHRFSLEYYPIKNLGIGGAYSITKYDASKFPFNNDFSGELNYSLKGFSVFAALRL
jgi:hypothetical protein